MASVASFTGQNLLSPLAQKWWHFFEIVQNTPRNRSLLMEYFGNEFAAAPQEFYEFLSYLKAWLKFSGKKADKAALAQKYLDILLPLCERFGFAKERDMLNDLAFQIVDPKQYAEIGQSLTKYKKKSAGIVRHILHILHEALPRKKYALEIIGRYKNIYSIFQKMTRKNRADIFNLRDIFAFRIILNDNVPEQCFEVLNLLHDHFHPLPEHFKDYISIPRINGYQSLHTGLTGVIPELDIPIEVQIRTKAMHEFAEEGLAAHWLYATQKVASHSTKKFLPFLLSQNNSAEKQHRVHFFSCDGDFFEMEQGGTVLDFAYQVHTDLGNKAKGALVNCQGADISYEIQEGDIIKVLSAKTPQVCPEWASCARNKLTLKRISSFLHS